jgi:phosphoribosylformylglycinamidine synthase
MQYIARVEVSLKPGHSDPEGEITKKALRELDYTIDFIKVSKIYELHFSDSSRKHAQKQVEEICRRLLSNPVKDNFEIEIEEI